VDLNNQQTPTRLFNNTFSVQRFNVERFHAKILVVV